MVAKIAASQTSSRRATQVCIQRLFASTLSPPAVMPPMSSGLEAAAPLLPLPRLIAPAAVTSTMGPCCLHCAGPMTWVDWYQDVQSLSIGRGQFYARCELCRAMDASFKDGPSP
jgi:hypothetical protein